MSLVRRHKSLHLQRAVGIPGGRLGEVPVRVDGHRGHPRQDSIRHTPEGREHDDEHGDEPQAGAALVDAQELEEEGEFDEGG